MILPMLDPFEPDGHSALPAAEVMEQTAVPPLFGAHLAEPGQRQVADFDQWKDFVAAR